MRDKNPWDSGWRLFLSSMLVIFGVLGILILVNLFFIKSKLEICHTYYPEISTISCFVSNYGLPARSK